MPRVTIDPRTGELVYDNSLLGPILSGPGALYGSPGSGRVGSAQRAPRTVKRSSPARCSAVASAELIALEDED